MKNKKIIDEFKKYLIYLESIAANKYKINHTKFMISFLKDFPKKISLSNSDKLLNYNNIGEKTVEKINVILKEGKLNIPDLDPVLTELMTVPYIGYKMAIKLRDKGIVSIQDLKYKINLGEIKLAKHIQIALIYDVKKNIPRKDIDDFKEIVKQFKIPFVICGSYRREKETSNDIDILLISPIYIFVENMKKNFEVKDITTCNEKSTKYTCIVKWKNIWRHIDIRSVSLESLYTALMYFTGSAEFNKRIRKIAMEKGCKLSEYELICNGKKIKIESEKDIFSSLDIKYIHPNKRNL